MQGVCVRVFRSRSTKSAHSVFLPELGWQEGKGVPEMDAMAGTGAAPLPEAGLTSTPSPQAREPQGIAGVGVGAVYTSAINISKGTLLCVRDAPAWGFSFQICKRH